MVLILVLSHAEFVLIVAKVATRTRADSEEELAEAGLHVLVERHSEAGVEHGAGRVRRVEEHVTRVQVAVDEVVAQEHLEEHVEHGEGETLLLDHEVGVKRVSVGRGCQGVRGQSSKVVLVLALAQ